MPVDNCTLVGDFAKSLISILEIKNASSDDANFLYLGKTLDHSLSFRDQNVQNDAKIIFTLKRRVNQA
jgi:hypothetical protein